MTDIAAVLSVPAPTIPPLFKLLNSQICAHFTEFCMTMNESDKAHLRLRDETQFFELVLHGKRGGDAKTFSVAFARESMLHQLTTVLKFIRASGNGGISSVQFILSGNALVISCNDKNHSTISNFKARVSGQSRVPLPHIASKLSIEADIKINNTSIRCLVEDDGFDTFQICVNRLAGKQNILEVVMKVIDAENVATKEFRVIAYDDGRENLPSDLETDAFDRLLADQKMTTTQVMRYNYVGSKVRDLSTSIAIVSVLNMMISEKGLLVLKYEMDNLVRNNDKLFYLYELTHDKKECTLFLPPYADED